ncbi:hypothetical protein ACFY40_11490 [Streptomyces sp. NPDC012950]|uniref:hypothetical protein n=1 Tax=Streptomyces sp. NPDC012950 TaxID=3364858 RepID=UPI0036BA2718
MTQPEPAHCGWTEFHAGHSFLRLEVLFHCPGTAGTQPEPAQPRHTADTITDDALTALYDQLDELRALLHDAEGDRDSWARDARRAEQQAETDARTAHTDLIDEQKRAGRAEQLATNLRAQAITEQKRADKAEAAIERVRQHCSPEQNTKSLGYLRESKNILALLDEAGPTRAEAERDAARNTLAEVLQHFVHKGHPGEPCLSSGWVRVATVEKWRAVLRHPAQETT